MTFAEVVNRVLPVFSEQEKRQDAVLQLSREIVRDSARAIRAIHTGELDECHAVVAGLELKMKKLKEIDEGFERISDSSYQEYVEIRSLLAVFERKEIPDYEELEIPLVPYLNGVADCVGELRRAIQISIKEGKKDDAEYYFQRLNDVYDNLMLLKFSSSLVGNLKRRQDVARSQVEQARGEMLKFA
ncbi:MAG: hypothetical protein WC792_03460 [Candidatus Micrarchaeia archaeon]|jgi:translin